MLPEFASMAPSSRKLQDQKERDAKTKRKTYNGRYVGKPP
jgi:hypothetical protein